MIALHHHAARFAAPALFICALALSACGDPEPDQRKAFIAFLQVRIVVPPGAHVPRPSTEEQKAFGPYNEHYEVISGFNAEINKALIGPYQIAQTQAPRSIADLVARRAEVADMAKKMTDMAAEMRRVLAATDVKRAALKQPDDLKRVYDMAYERAVQAPAQSFLATIPVAVDGLNASSKLADYLDKNRATVKVSGSTIDTRNDRARAEINQLLKAMAAQQERLAEARQKMKVVFEGK
jgi:Protein of unknown function (DUF3053)